MKMLIASVLLISVLIVSFYKAKYLKTKREERSKRMSRFLMILNGSVMAFGFLWSSILAGTKLMENPAYIFFIVLCGSGALYGFYLLFHSFFSSDEKVLEVWEKIFSRKLDIINLR